MNLDEIETLARAAQWSTDGQWVDSPPTEMEPVELRCDLHSARYIAALSPATVLWLVAMARRAEKLENLADGLEHDDTCSRFSDYTDCTCYIRFWRAAFADTGGGGEG